MFDFVRNYLFTFLNAEMDDKTLISFSVEY